MNELRERARGRRAQNPFDGGAEERLKRMDLLKADGEANKTTLLTLSAVFAGLLFDELCDFYQDYSMVKDDTVQAIVQRLNEEADTARRYLDLCELEVMEPRYCDNFILKLLYEILSKKTSQRVRLPDGVFDMTTAVHGIYEE